MAQELSDADVFGSGELSDEEVFGAPGKRRKSQSLGFMEGVGQVAKNYSRANPLNALDTKAARDVRGQADASMRDYFARREQTEEPGMIGKIAGGVLATAPIAAVSRNPFVVGGLSGAAASEANDAGGVAFDAATGAVLGKVADKAVRGAAGMLKPAVDRNVQLLRDAGVKLTPGQARGGKAMLREDKAMSRPAVGEAIAQDRNQSLLTWNKATVDRAIAPLGKKVPDDVPAGFDAVKYAQQVVDDAYNRVVPNLTVRADPRFAANLRRVWSEVQLLPEAQQKQFQALIGTIKFGQGGSLSGRALKDAQSKLGTIGRKYGIALDPDQAGYGNAVFALKDALDDMIVRQNPKHAPDLKKANQAFRGLFMVEDAASRGDDGLFSTGQFKQAVRRGDASKRKKAVARGDAYMQDWSNAARAVLPAKVPNSGTAERLNSGNLLAQVAGRAEQAGYRGRQAFQNALSGRAGPAAEAAANALLKINPGLVVAAGLLPAQTK